MLEEHFLMMYRLTLRGCGPVRLMNGVHWRFGEVRIRLLQA
jgi:hypothetical protein